MGMIGNSLAQGLVSGANIQDGTVDTADLKDGGVTPAKLSTGHPLWDSVGQLTLPRNDTTNEGGQINFQRAVDASASWYIDLYGNNTTPTLRFVDGANVRMAIDGSGNVGIGTSSPYSKLSVIGEISSGSSSADNTGQGNISIYSNTGNSSKPRAQFIVLGSSYASNYQAIRANNAVLYSAYADLCLNADTSNNIQFWTGANERMRIDSSGNLLVGQTTGNYVISAAASANNGAKITNLTMGRSGSEYGSVGYGVRYTGTTNSYTYDVTDYASMIRFNNGNVETLTAQFGTAGNAISFTTGPYVARGGISWTNGSSDVRLKKNFEPSQGLSELLQVEPVKYHFNWEEDGTPKRLGFKAQNLLPVIPEMVSEKDELAEDGTPLLTITPDYMLPVLVKAIQEQQVLIEAMQTRLAALEAA